MSAMERDERAEAVAAMDALPMPVGPVPPVPVPAEVLANVVAGVIRDYDRDVWDATGNQIADLRRALFEYRDRAEAPAPAAPALSPWQRAVDGLNALVDADIAFHIEPDGHISGPFGDEHIEWDHDTARWRLVHDDDSHEATVAEYLSTPYTDDTGSSEAEALAAVDRSIAAQFPLLTALRAEQSPVGSLLGRLGEPGVEEALLVRIMQDDSSEPPLLDSGARKGRATDSGAQ